MECSLIKWAAWSPGLETKEDWQHWIKNGEILKKENSPDVSHMPRLLRRRLSRMSKMALNVAHQCAHEKSNIYNIFCSGRGEYDHSFKVLNEICSGDEISPAAFGASVHNTSQGLFSILQKNQRPALFLSGNSDSLEQAVSIACAKLQDGEKEVLVVYHDDLLPDIYSEDAQVLSKPLALALLLENKSELPVLKITHNGEDKADNNENSAWTLIKLILQKDKSSTFQQAAWRWSLESA